MVRPCCGRAKTCSHATLDAHINIIRVDRSLNSGGNFASVVCCVLIRDIARRYAPTFAQKKKRKRRAPGIPAASVFAEALAAG